MKKSKKMNPAEALGKMQRAKRGVAVGSQLEGGTIKYKDGGQWPKKGSKTLGAFAGGIASQVMQTLMTGDARKLRQDRVAERDKLMENNSNLSKKDAMKQARKNIKN